MMQGLLSKPQVTSGLLVCMAFALAHQQPLHAAERPVIAPAPQVFTQSIRPFLKEHCVSCHGADLQEFGLRYDQLTGFRAEDRHLWTLIHQQVAQGKMPPAEQPQPSAAEKQQLLQWIEQHQRALRQGGSVRRLNRRELSAALQDITGLHVDYTRALPADGKVNGFDTGVDALQDAADSVAQVMEVTRRAVHGLRFRKAADHPVFTANLQDHKDPRKALDEWKKLGAYVKVRGQNLPGAGLLLDPGWLKDRNGLTFNVPSPNSRKGIVRVTAVVSVYQGNFAEIPNPNLWVKIGGHVVDHVEVTGTREQPQRLTWEVQIDDAVIESRGLEISLLNKVEMPYAVKGFKNEDKTKPEEKLTAGLYRPLYDRKAKLTPAEKPIPWVVLHNIEIDPDYQTLWPPETPASTNRLDDDTHAAQLLALWTERAWRRPVTTAELSRFLALYKNLRQQGAGFDEALKAAFHAVLLSAPFRYLSSPATSDATVTEYALASRLSFMLQGAPPDRELLELAARGQLSQAKVLEAQVQRLLNSPRSEAFVRPFVKQWLELEQPITVAMTHLSQQDFQFGRNLKQSMQDETIHYVGELIRDNRPASELIESDWTMLNNILAHHYGIEDINGGHFRKVKLKADNPRGGGLLAHAGIQSMLCWMGDNWVIYRGAWTLRHLLDSPPPPPPLEVPELNPADNANRGKTFRELLKQHQADSRCSVCHQHMDPLGFAFQNFDLAGRWRKVEHERYNREELDGKVAWNGVGKTRPVDANGHLPRGETFSSFQECKQQLAKHYQAELVRGLLKNLMIYATGRRPDVHDLREIDTIIQQQKKNGYRVRDLITALLLTNAFRDR